MPLSAGDKLGPYEVLSPIGAGGMGEVYKARDTRLDRTVAVKVLPDHIAQRDEIHARFEREARAVASLNHPNICTLFDIGPGYMVMELIEGESLADRIAKGPIPLDQALRLATQIADALDRAHRAGVTHRDVKPQNIMLTRDGVKVLDFGLAKSQAAPGPTEATLTKVLTTEGTVMGTPQYMAPEQFEGKEADARSDIWAFGAVLYEMVTGRKAFEGKSYSSLLGAILSADPAPMAVQPFTPASLENLVKRCLRKDPEDRYQSMRDVVLDLRTPPAETAVPTPSRSLRWPWIAAIALPAVIAGLLGFARLTENPPAAPLLRATLLLPPNVFHDGTSIAVSPDGKRVVFSGRSADGKVQLWARPLDALAALPLAGTDGAADPFWSPDGQSIGFFASGMLKRIDATGGPVLSLTGTDRTEATRGASWSPSGVIIFDGSGSGPLKRVSASGGTVSDATKLAGNDSTHRRPWFLPDGKHFVFVAGAGGSAAPKTVRLGSLDNTDSTKIIDAADSVAVYSAGHLLYLRAEVLMAQPFDARKLTISGDAVPVVESVPGGGIGTAGGFSASANGLIVHASGSRYFSDLTWFDRKGNRTANLGEPGMFQSLSFSADRSSVVVAIANQNQDMNVWLVDGVRGLRTPIGSRNVTQQGTLSPDGRIAFYPGVESGHPQILRKRLDCTGGEELIYEGDIYQEAFSISPDGKFLLSRTRQGLWILPEPLGPPGKSKPYLLPQTRARSSHGQFSPDGRWIAYESDESGRDEIYIAPFPGPGLHRQVTTSGGSRPAGAAMAARYSSSRQTVRFRPPR